VKRNHVAVIAVIVAAVAGGLAWYLRRPSATPGGSGSGSGSGSSTAGAGVEAGTTGAAGSADPDDGAEPSGYRVIDADARMALMRRITAARAAHAAGKPAPAIAPDPDDPPPLPGELTADEILGGLMPVLPLLKECYQQGLDRRTVKNGEVTFKLALAGAPDVGTLVDSAELDGDPAFLADAELSQCLQETLMSVELPPMKDGSELRAEVKMSFSDDDDGDDGGSGTGSP